MCVLLARGGFRAQHPDVSVFVREVEVVVAVAFLTWISLLLLCHFRGVVGQYV